MKVGESAEKGHAFRFIKERPAQETTNKNYDRVSCLSCLTLPSVLRQNSKKSLALSFTYFCLFISQEQTPCMIEHSRRCTTNVQPVLADLFIHRINQSIGS